MGEVNTPSEARAERPRGYLTVIEKPENTQLTLAPPFIEARVTMEAPEEASEWSTVTNLAVVTAVSGTYRLHCSLGTAVVRTIFSPFPPTKTNLPVSAMLTEFVEPVPKAILLPGVVHISESNVQDEATSESPLPQSLNSPV